MRWSAKHVFRTATVVSFLIGSDVLPSQSQPQDSQAVISVEVRHTFFRSEFGGLLDDANPGGWLPGWQLAQDCGRPVSLLLWDLWKSEASRLNRRLLVLGALGQAAGAATDESFDDVLVQMKDQEKVMSTVVLALGPRRPHGMDNLARLTDREQEMVVRVAAYAALSRYEAEIPQLNSRGDRADPGLFAAALHAGLRPGPQELEPWFRAGSRQPKHAHLVWRGFLLADLSADPDRNERLQRAQWVYTNAIESILEVRDARRAAALCLARLGDPTLVLDAIGQPDPEFLVLMATVVAMRSAMPGEWFPPVPTTVRLGATERRRLAVLYALKQPVDDVLSDGEQWASDEEIRGAVCLALAWRILDGEPVGVPIPASVSALAEGAWVQWAAGEPSSFSANAMGDRILSQAAGLAQAGRLPVAGARQVLEQALWRSGSHPALSHVEAEVALLRDLVLSGSIEVSARLDVTPNDRYLATGIPTSDRDFFKIAYEYLLFAAVPPVIPASLRFR